MEDRVCDSLTCSVTENETVGLYAHNTRMYACKTVVTATEKVIMLTTVGLRYGGQRGETQKWFFRVLRGDL